VSGWVRALLAKRSCSSHNSFAHFLAQRLAGFCSHAIAGWWSLRQCIAGRTGLLVQAGTAKEIDLRGANFPQVYRERDSRRRRYRATHFDWRDEVPAMRNVVRFYLPPKLVVSSTALALGRLPEYISRCREGAIRRAKFEHNREELEQKETKAQWRGGVNVDIYN
jgi:hypothetical protein